MPTPRRSTLTLAFLSGSLAIACSQAPLTSRAHRPQETKSATNVNAVNAVKPTAASPAPQSATQPDPYALGLTRASSAVNISQSAQSRDDWRLVADRWQQAIESMATVPASHRNHAQAMSKLEEYRRNLAFAQQQSNSPTTAGSGSSSGSSSGIVVSTSQTSSTITSSPPITALPPQRNSSSGSAGSSASSGGSTSSGGSSSADGAEDEPESGVFHTPIVRRAGNTPVIAVTFNGSQTYEMILDTGASGTLITPAMASSLGIRAVGQTSVDTASAQGVSFNLGYVDSMEVGGAVANNVLVAMSGPDLDLGLLGHDFFGNYDIIIRENEVEFRVR